MDKKTILSKIRHGLIVSCQAEGNEPLNTPDILTAMAKAAVNGGAVAIRAENPKNIVMMKQSLDVPIIGLNKVHYSDSEVYITPTLNDALAVLEAGADIIAMDATNRERHHGEQLRDIVDAVRKRGDALLMADVSNFEEGLTAHELGFDLIGTTLSGYTEYKKKKLMTHNPDFELVRDLIRDLGDRMPIIAEGRIWTPRQAVAAFQNGAFAIVIGTSITRPTVITRKFVDQIKRYHHLKTQIAIGVDLGGTKTAIGLISYDGTIHTKHIMTTPWKHGMENLVNAISDQIIEIVKRTSHQIEIVGIAATGRVDQSQGLVFDGIPMIEDYLGYPLVKAFSSRLNMPVYIENDANASAVAEYEALSRKPERFVYITIGTGIGGGIIIDGKLIRGTGNAGEIGHICVAKNGVPCSCGRRGCLESYVSRKRLADEIMQNLTTRGIHWEHNSLPLRTDQIINYIRSGDAEIEAIFKRQMDYLACGIESINQIIEPEMIVFGGEMSTIGDLLLSEIISRLHTPVDLRIGKFSNDAGIIGAARLAIEQAVING